MTMSEQEKEHKQELTSTSGFELYDDDSERHKERRGEKRREGGIQWELGMLMGFQTLPRLRLPLDSIGVSMLQRWGTHFILFIHNHVCSLLFLGYI